MTIAFSSLFGSTFSVSFFFAMVENIIHLKE
jgi:hypothetical protein